MSFNILFIILLNISNNVYLNIVLSDFYNLSNFQTNQNISQSSCLVVRCDFMVWPFSGKLFIFSGKIIIITIFHLSMKSKSIKLLVTNNNSHRNSTTIEHFQSVSSPVNDHQNNSRSPSSPKPQFQHPLCLSEFQKQSFTQNEIKSMFTIREQQSYEYQSEIGSICLNKKLPESRIDQLSTIKAEHNKQNYHINSTGQQNSKFFTSAYFQNPNNHFCSFGYSRENPSRNGSKLKENQTTGSMNTFQHSFEDNTPNIEAWQQKINDKHLRLNDGNQEQILQEQMIVLKETERSLKLNKVKLPLIETKLKGNEKIKKGYDIHYNCSEEQLQEIIKILEKQGIKLVKKSECQTKLINRKDEIEQKGQLNDKKVEITKKKIKIKMVKPRDKKIKRNELSGKQKIVQ